MWISSIYPDYICTGLKLTAKHNVLKTLRWLPAKSATVTSLRHRDQCVGDGSPDVGSHDDRNSYLHCKHCQKQNSASVLLYPLIHSSSISIIHSFMLLCLCKPYTHILMTPCWQLWRRMWMSSGPEEWPGHQWPDRPEGWTKLSCLERCHLLLYLDWKTY